MERIRCPKCGRGDILIKASVDMYLSMKSNPQLMEEDITIHKIYLFCNYAECQFIEEIQTEELHKYGIDTEIATLEIVNDEHFKTYLYRKLPNWFLEHEQEQRYICPECKDRIVAVWEYEKEEGDEINPSTGNRLGTEFVISTDSYLSHIKCSDPKCPFNYSNSTAKGGVMKHVDPKSLIEEALEMVKLRNTLKGGDN